MRSDAYIIINQDKTQPTMEYVSPSVPLFSQTLPITGGKPKTIFYYGTMNCGKSAKILQLIHSYKEQGKTILTVKPTLANRQSENCIVTRSGERYPADVLEYKDDFHLEFFRRFRKKINSMERLDCVAIDEAQFLNLQHFDEIVDIVSILAPNAPIMLFGLLKDFQNHLFPTSKYLVENCTSLREIKSMCWMCNKKATCNLRLNNGKPVYNGKQIQIGGNDNYLGVCSYHYEHPEL